MASISSTDSIGNTSLRGYGGMASGIDRDAIIEKMTLGTTTKINNQQSKITQLQWKQEAYRNISDQLIDFGDKYTSFSSTDSLIDPNFFAKSIISIHGRDEATRFVTASGSSDLINNVSLKGVEKLATSTVWRSDGHNSGNNGIVTSVNDLAGEWKTSNLKGKTLVFEKSNGVGQKPTRINLVLPDGYTDDAGKTHEIRYTNYEKLQDLADDLNNSLAKAGVSIENKELGDLFRFEADGNKLRLIMKDSTLNGYTISGNAMEALGYGNGPIKASEIDSSTQVAFEENGIIKKSALEGMKGAKLTFNYDGSSKEIELITQDEFNAIKDLPSESDKKEAIVKNLNERLNRAFGSGMVEASFASGSLSFKTSNKTSSISIVSNDYALLKNLDIEYGESNKVNLNGKISQASLLGDAAKDLEGELDLKINGVAIKGLTKDSTISDILSKINATSEAGVKATYVDATGQFMLVSSETGAGRQISLDSKLANELFGVVKTDDAGNKITDADGNETYYTYADKKNSKSGISDGQNAVICVSYGNGIDVRLERASNTFDLEGLSVSVSGAFGGKFNGDVWEADSAGGVTFSAKADVDAIVERVKGFFEDFNKIATDVNNEITTRPDSSYGPLTDEQKKEMDDTSIENWEKKAKQGMLYGDSAMRDLSTDVQSVFLKLMNSMGKDGYEKLKQMGITYSDDYGDGGTISFDESKFRTAVEKDSEAVGNLFTGGGGVSKGLVAIMDETFTPYATRYASKNGGGKGSYGRLIEIAGSEKKPTSLLNNQIYNEIQNMQDQIARLREQLKTEQDRYISQFTTMESLLNQMNTQSSYLSQLTG